MDIPLLLLTRNKITNLGKLSITKERKSDQGKLLRRSSNYRKTWRKDVSVISVKETAQDGTIPV